MEIRDARLPKVAPWRNASGDVDGDLAAKTVADYVAMALIVYSALAESWGLAQPVGLEWIGALLGLGATKSVAYNSKRKQDVGAAVEKHKADREAEGYVRAAAARGQTAPPAAIAPAVAATLSPAHRVPVVPTDAPIGGSR